MKNMSRNMLKVATHIFELFHFIKGLCAEELSKKQQKIPFIIAFLPGPADSLLHLQCTAIISIILSFLTGVELCDFMILIPVHSTVCRYIHNIHETVFLIFVGVGHKK